MAESLLAHLYSRIKGSQEDVATLSLQYILSQSAELNQAFTKQIAEYLGIELGELHYICQATGENNERPDMAGVDAFGNEHVLCEMKFYAGLTEKQPWGYIRRLKDLGGKGLLFICPDARRNSLWAKIQELCQVNSDEQTFLIEVDGIALALATWSEILNRLNEVASSLAVGCLSDINQLIGFCAQMDSEAFIPFTSEDLTAEVAKKIDRLYRVVDETMLLLAGDKNISASATGKASNTCESYIRRIFIDEFKVRLIYDRYLWKDPSSVETPFWITIDNKDDEFTLDMQKKYQGISDVKKGTHWGWYMIALEPLTNATLEEVCLDLKRQILEYLNFFR